LLCTLASGSAHAGTEIGINRKCGLGITLGSPTGLSGKCYLPDRVFAIDAVLAYQFIGRNGGALYVHSTALWHPTELYDDTWGTVPWYVGVGPFVGTWFANVPGNSGTSASDWALGVRAPVGIGIDFAEVPIQIFVEVAIHVTVLPGVYVGPGFGLGGRYYF